jgi:hypothetical protein
MMLPIKISPKKTKRKNGKKIKETKNKIYIL